MHFLFISLLAILTGTLLLAKTRKEALGKLFARISWFFIVVGFFLFVVFIAGGICKLAHHGRTSHPGFRHEMMMNHMRPGMPGGMGCPPGMCKDPMEMKDNFMKKDSLMKCCPKQAAGDTCKMGHPKPIPAGKTH